MAPKERQAWIHRSFALHEMNRTQEAFDKLLPAAKRFPKFWLVPFHSNPNSVRLIVTPHNSHARHRWVGRLLLRPELCEEERPARRAPFSHEHYIRDGCL